jgi:8-oxo-dGTP pyrophosphatase MutT (NUDIX family)
VPLPEFSNVATGAEGFHIREVERVYEGPRIDVARATVVGPDGSVFEREIVRHPGAVAVVPVTESGSVLLVRQFRTPVGGALLEIPAGTRDVEGEPPEQTALRELAEEVGVKAGRIEELGRFWNSPGFCDEETILYLATELEACEPDRGGIEEQYLEVLEVPLDEVEGALARDGTFDMQTVVGVMLARRVLAERLPS